MQRILLSSGAQERTVRFELEFRSADYPNTAYTFPVKAAFKFPTGSGMRVETVRKGNTVVWLKHEENAWQHDYVTGVIQATPTDINYRPATGAYSDLTYKYVGILAAIPNPTTFYNLPPPVGCLAKGQSWLSECMLDKNQRDSTFKLNFTICTHHWVNQAYRIGQNWYTEWRQADSQIQIESEGKLDALGGIVSFTKFIVVSSSIIAPNNRLWKFNVENETLLGTLPMARIVSSPTFNGSSVAPPILGSTVDVTPIEKWPERFRKSAELEVDNGEIFRGAIDALSQCAEVHTFSIENMSDIVGIKETLQGLLEVSRDGIRAILTRKPLLMLRVLCACHIIYRYVIKTTAKDGKEFIHLVKEIWKHRHMLTELLGPLLGKSTRLRQWLSIYGPVNTVQRINIVLGRDSWCNGAYNRLKGIALTPGMFWDAVPLSFVLDWFLPIGDLISSAQMWYDYNNRDTNVLASVLGVNHRCRRIVKFGTTHTFYGEIVCFTRKVVKGPLQCNTSYSFSLKNPFKNSATAFALLVQFLVKRD